MNLLLYNELEQKPYTEMMIAMKLWNWSSCNDWAVHRSIMEYQLPGDDANTRKTKEAYRSVVAESTMDYEVEGS